VIQRSLVVVALAGLLVACGGGGTTPTTAPGGGSTAQPPGAATPAPGVATPAPGGNNSGDFEAMVRALAPAGSTEIQFVESGGLTALYLSSTMPLDQLEAFFDQAIPAQGITVSGKSEMAGTLIYSLENPVGGVVVSPADQAGHAITISLGESQ
jgi:hypothetical protein